MAARSVRHYCGRGGVVVQREELAQGRDQALARGGAGRVLERDGGIVQQLADDAPGERLDRLALGGVEPVEPSAEAVELGDPHVLGARSRSATIIGATSRAEVAPR